MMLGIGLNIWTKSAGGASFSPLSLFSGGETGGWWDVSDLSSMFQLSTGTTAAEVGSPVGYVGDKSGRGSHLLQATASKRPILRQTGAYYYLEFDGIDDTIRAVFTLAQPLTRMFAAQQASFTAFDYLWDGAGVTAATYQTSTSPELSINAGTVAGAAYDTEAVGVTQIYTELINGASSKTAINSNALKSISVGANNPSGLTVAARGDGGANFCNLYWFGGLCIGRTLLDTELASVRTYLAAKSGVSL